MCFFSSGERERGGSSGKIIYIFSTEYISFTVCAFIFLRNLTLMIWISVNYHFRFSISFTLFVFDCRRFLTLEHSFTLTLSRSLDSIKIPSVMLISIIGKTLKWAKVCKKKCQQKEREKNSWDFFYILINSRGKKVGRIFLLTSSRVKSKVFFCENSHL